MNFKNLKTTILNRLNIVDVVGHYLKLEKKGNNYWAICPFHHDTKPSLSVSEKLQIYRCFTCNHSGNLIKFVQSYKNLNLKNTIKEIVETFNLDKSLMDGFHELSPEEAKKFRLYELNNLVSFWYEHFLYNQENKHAYDYLIQRGLNDELIKKFKIGFAPLKKDIILKLATNENNIRNLNANSDEVFNVDELLEAQLIKVNKDGEFYDFFYDRITFSILNEDEQVIGFSARALDKNVEPKYINTSTNLIFKKDNVLYNIHELIKTPQLKTVYVVEGFMDTIALAKVNVNNVVATMGVNFSEHHFLKLKEVLKGLDTIILAFDNDQAGFDAKLKIGQSLASLCNIFILDQWKDPYKDLDELVKNTNETHVLETLNKTTDFYLFYLNHQYLNNPQLNNVAYQKQILDEILKKVYLWGNPFFQKQYETWIEQHLNLKINLDPSLFKKLNLKEQDNELTKKFVKKEPANLNQKLKKRKTVLEETNDSLKYLYFRVFIWMFFDKRFLELALHFNLIDFSLYFKKDSETKLIKDDFYNEIFHLIIAFYENNPYEHSLFFANKTLVETFLEANVHKISLLKIFQTIMSYSYEFLINTETVEHQEHDFKNLVKMIELKKLDLELLPLLKAYETNKDNYELRQKIINLKKQKNLIYKKY